MTSIENTYEYIKKRLGFLEPIVKELLGRERQLK
jgi:hypothetical protein